MGRPGGYLEKTVYLLEKLACLRKGATVGVLLLDGAERREELIKPALEKLREAGLSVNVRSQSRESFQACSNGLVGC